MKLSLLLLASGVAGLTTIGELCGPGTSLLPAEAPAARATPAMMPAMMPVSAAAAADTVTLKIEGMTCAGCTIATRKVLERLDGVQKADVSYERKLAIVTYDPAKVTTRQMIAAVATLDYTATVVP